MQISFLENFPKVVAICTTILVTLTVSYELAYFFVVGSHFQKLLTAYDYFVSSLYWLPYIVALMLIILTVRMLIMRAEDFKSENELLDKAPKPVKLFRRSTTWLLVSGFVAGAIVDFTIGNPYSAITLLFVSAFIWMKIWEYVLDHKKIDTVTRGVGIFLFGYVPGFVALLMMNGVWNAYGDMTKDHKEYEIQYKDETKRNFVLLRTIDRGIIVRRPSSQVVSFIPWNEVSRVSYTAGPFDTSSLGCRWFGIFCDPPEIP